MKEFIRNFVPIVSAVYIITYTIDKELETEIVEKHSN